MNVTAIKAIPLALPKTSEADLAHRKLKAKRTLNDLVEDVHIALVENDKYYSFLNAVYDEQAVEGSLDDDDHEAARMIREKAEKMGYSELARQKIATIRKCLGVVLRRYEFDRRTRRNTVRGEIVSE